MKQLIFDLIKRFFNAYLLIMLIPLSKAIRMLDSGSTSFCPGENTIVVDQGREQCDSDEQCQQQATGTFCWQRSRRCCMPLDGMFSSS